MSQHIAIATTARGNFDTIQVPTRSPGSKEVLIKVEYGALSAFDTYVTDRGFYVKRYPMTLGLGASGIVSEVGSEVNGLKAGDRVAAYTFGESQNKGLQEYVTLSDNVVSKIPDSLHLAEAATLPNSFVAAFYTLFSQLDLPIPSSFPEMTPPPLASVPILIYGAGSTSGIYAVQLLHLAGYKRIIATASKKNHKHLRSLGATEVFDYNNPAIVEDIRTAVGGDGTILLAMDCISAESTTLKVLGKVMSPSGKIAILLPIKEGGTVTNSDDREMYSELRQDRTPFPKETDIVYVRTFLYQQDDTLRDALMPKILPTLLELGAIKPSPMRLLDEGSLKDRVGIGLQLFRENKVSSEKVIMKMTA